MGVGERPTGRCVRAGGWPVLPTWWGDTRTAGVAVTVAHRNKPKIQYKLQSLYES